MAEDYWPNRATSENMAMTENALLESIDRRLGDQLKSMTDFHERTNKSLGETEAQMKVLTLIVLRVLMLATPNAPNEKFAVLNSEVCSMAASTSVHSDALNFMSSLKSGVDPRTGLYNVSITLPELQSNDLLGPGFNLDLSYSPLNTVDKPYAAATIKPYKTIASQPSRLPSGERHKPSYTSQPTTSVPRPMAIACQDARSATDLSIIIADALK